MEFGKSYWRSFEKGSEREWIVTNGLGGYASQTLICSNSRRYHGLLVAALRPPVDRHMLLSNVLEDICFENGETVSLSSFKVADGYINNGFENLQRVEYDLLPKFTYNYKDVFIKKKIAMVYGSNTTVISYEIRNGARKTVFKLTPLVNFRNHHHTSTFGNLNFGVEANQDGISIQPSNTDISLKLSCDTAVFNKYNSCFFYGMTYGTEGERGLGCSEDHFIPGCFELTLKPYENRILSFVATIENISPVKIDAATVIEDEIIRQQQLLNKKGYKDELCRALVLAADRFIVYRKSTDSKTVIAGYPWFTDWGRDTMIAFNGLTLATGRYDDAKDILYTFSKYINYGLIPNVFPDDDAQPAYNSIDAVLWYFEAVNNYIDYTQDYEFVKDKLYPCLGEICERLIKGTIYDIYMDEDGLISAGNENTQLTWMDAKVGDWVVTPRHGKAVEINALWYNALRIMSRLSIAFKQENPYKKLSERVKKSFDRVFWNENGQYLFDVVNQNGADDSIRPNQIIAVSLSYNVLDKEKAKKVVEKVWTELYTAYGLRTLSTGNVNYHGVYQGDVWSRDGAYHQGTVWTWPLGRFIKAYVFVNNYSIEARNNAKDFIMPFIDHMRDAGIGSISEIFDGDEPFYPRGCFAQAWSVSEILRAAIEDVGIEGLHKR